VARNEAVVMVAVGKYLVTMRLAEAVVIADCHVTTHLDQ
jgi:hypothetical protein